MVTKAELESEVAQLREQIAAMKRESAVKAEPATTASDSKELRLPSPIQDLLDEHGIDSSNIEAAGQQIAGELAGLQRDYPLATLVGVFVLGLIAGRALR